MLSTCERMIRSQIPNLLRLYLNPFVAQTCIALNEIVHARWPNTLRHGDFPSFLANSRDEALSGAIKLARYTLSQRESRTDLNAQSATLLVGSEDAFDSFAYASLPNIDGTSRRIEFIPDVTQVKIPNLRHRLSVEALCAKPLGTIVLSPQTLTECSDESCAAIQQFQSRGGILIACLDTTWHQFIHAETTSSLTPDVVVFGECFTRNEVPFGAFTARPDMYAQWNTKGMATFHSTTYQPNTISTMHFMKCLQESSPQFFDSLSLKTERLCHDPAELKKVFRKLYNPALCRLIRATEFDTDKITATGHYVRVHNTNYFDGIGGVACSLRGHNPDSFVKEMRELDSVADCREEVAERLRLLTGLPHHVPAVSGGSAVEHALKLALTAQSSKPYIVALKGGFGGKTLLALSGTSKAFYKKGVDPLYPHVIYLDPFADDATDQLSQILRQYPVAVIQLELIQGVGGVREIPDALLNYLQIARQETGVLLFVDEIQTGMFRTGPFVRSTLKRVAPDLLTIGKGTSDMMFPFAMTLYSSRIESLLRRQQSHLSDQLNERYRFEMGYRCVLNTLRRAEHSGLADAVLSAEEQFRTALQRELRGNRIVRDARIFGLLIGIELDLKNSWLSRIRLNVSQMYLLQMMKQKQCPVLMGFCQYEPHILKFTPPLTVTTEEIESVSRSIAGALDASSFSLLISGLRAMWRSRSERRFKQER